MKGWIGRLSLRYKLTLAALGVEALMLSFLIANGVQLATHSLQIQAEHHVDDVAKTLEAALLGSLAQQDDASVPRPPTPQSRPEPRVAAPAPAASRPRAARHEVSPPQARQLPGEPANRLSPNRAETRPPARVERQAPAARPQGEPGPTSRERPGGKS